MFLNCYTMTRKLSLFLAALLIACPLTLTGCDGGGGEAEYEETDAMTQEEIEEAEEYEAAMEAQAAETAAQ